MRRKGFEGESAPAMLGSTRKGTFCAARLVHRLRAPGQEQAQPYGADLQELLAERGLDLSDETIRSWVLKRLPRRWRPRLRSRQGLAAARRPAERCHVAEHGVKRPITCTFFPAGDSAHS
jgi:hypothetical protein